VVAFYAFIKYLKIFIICLAFHSIVMNYRGLLNYKISLIYVPCLLHLKKKKKGYAEMVPYSWDVFRKGSTQGQRSSHEEQLAG